MQEKLVRNSYDAMELSEKGAEICKDIRSVWDIKNSEFDITNKKWEQFEDDSKINEACIASAVKDSWGFINHTFYTMMYSKSFQEIE